VLAYQILHFSEFFLGLFRWVQKFNGLNIVRSNCICLPHTYQYLYLYKRRDRITTFFGDTAWHGPFSKFQTPNGRSKPFNMINILRVTWKPNFTFFWIFLLFIKYLTKSLNPKPLNFWTHLNKPKKNSEKCKI